MLSYSYSPPISNKALRTITHNYPLTANIDRKNTLVNHIQPFIFHKRIKSAFTACISCKARIKSSLLFALFLSDDELGFTLRI